MKNEGGFTLLEIMVAMAILGTGFLLVVQLFSGGARLASASDRYLTGVQLANHKFTELELQNFQLEAASGVFEENPDYRWDAETGPYVSPLNDPENGIQLSQITLNVRWEDGKREHSVTLASLYPNGTLQPAPDVVLLGNVSGLGSGNGGLNTSASGSGGPRNITGTGNPLVSAGPGAVQPPPGVSAPAFDPNLPQTDISGNPVTNQPSGKAPLIGLAGG